MLVPHQFKPAAHGVPTIFITQEAAEEMWGFVDLSSIEVGWYGLVTHRSVLGKGQSFLIDKVYLPAQNCHATTTEITPQGQAALYNQLMEEDDKAGITPDSPDYKINRLRAWFH